MWAMERQKREKIPQASFTQRESPMCVQSLHCYCYLLERLINIWAYHSGRRMLHVNVDTVGRSSPSNFSPRAGQTVYEFVQLFYIV
jgi:hypothetical protein